jgi:hypothetical protein
MADNAISPRLHRGIQAAEFTVVVELLIWRETKIVSEKLNHFSRFLDDSYIK